MHGVCKGVALSEELVHVLDAAGAPIKYPVGTMIPGTRLTPTDYSVTPPEYRCDCGIVFHISRAAIERRFGRKSCGMCVAYTKQEPVNPIGKQIDGSHLIPINYDVSPAHYLCTLCNQETYQRRWQVDQRVIVSCGCKRQLRKHTYWKTVCPHCKHERAHFNTVGSTIFCCECSHPFDPAPQPARNIDYVRYLKSRRTS